VHQYLTEWIEHGERMREEQEKNPPPVILRLRRLREIYGKEAARIVREQQEEAYRQVLAEGGSEYRTKNSK